MELFEELGETLTGGSNLGALSGFLGADDNATKGLLGMAGPALLGGLGKRAASPAGAEALLGAAKNADGGLLDNLGGFLGAGDKGGAGAGLVGSILGGRQNAVEAGLAQQSGLGSGMVKKLLPMLAPMVMSFIGKKVTGGGLNAGGLTSMLSGNSNAMRSGGLGGIMDLLDGGDDEADNARFLSGLSSLSGKGTAAATAAVGATAAAGAVASGAGRGGIDAVASPTGSNGGGFGSMLKWLLPLLAIAAAVVLLLWACGGDDDDESASAGDGSAVCPSNLVIQTDWWPEIEHAGSYQLIGPDGTSDAETFRYSGPIQSQYAVGGIETVEVRSGGDAVSFSPVTSLMYEDSDITLGYVNASDAIKDTGTNAVVGVAKTLELNPQMVMWDPAQFDISEPGDLGASGARLLHFDGTTYTDFLVGEGFIDEGQLDPSYGGAPDQFIESNGGILQQGFASNELYKYENDIAWKDGAAAPVEFFLIHDLGFEDYPAMYTVRADKVDEMAPCLEVLVPVLSQAWVDALEDPTTIGDALVSINDTFDTYWKVSPGINAVASELFNDGIGVNSADGTYCSFDTDRVSGLIDIVQPVLEARGIEMAADLSADTLVTNRFCDGAPGR